MAMYAGNAAIFWRYPRRNNPGPPVALVAAATLVSARARVWQYGKNAHVTQLGTNLRLGARVLHFTSGYLRTRFFFW
jgi:hypothetical protein